MHATEHIDIILFGCFLLDFLKLETDVFNKYDIPKADTIDAAGANTNSSLIIMQEK